MLGRWSVLQLKWMPPCSLLAIVEQLRKVNVMIKDLKFAITLVVCATCFASTPLLQVSAVFGRGQDLLRREQLNLPEMTRFSCLK